MGGLDAGAFLGDLQIHEDRCSEFLGTKSLLGCFATQPGLCTVDMFFATDLQPPSSAAG